ncbi:hypothetical protein KM043_018126 [Ampulex compressa]|nr:hypothetical protein KM043_018126 [Ampulex compressa]
MTDSPSSTVSAFFRIINKVVTLVKCIVRTGFVILNNVYCIPTYVVWMTLLFPVKVYQPQVYWRIEGLFFHWLLAMVSMWTWSAGYDIIEQGDDIQKIVSERTLVIANHQSTGDVPMLMTTFNAKPNVLPNLMWIMDRVFKFTNFGIVSILHQDFFIVSGRKRREESLKQLERHLKESYIPRNRKWMVLFPEGGFLCKRRETSQKYAKKNNLPILENVTLPRVGAMQTIFDTIGPTQENNVPDQQLNSRPSMMVAKPEISWVLDITIAYPQGKPIDLPTIITGSRPPCETVLFYRLFPSSVVPREPELLSKWLYDRWAEKEALLENFYNGVLRCITIMTTLRPFTSNDLFKFNNMNLDPLTETYGLSFYMHYLAHWPEYFQVAESPSGEMMGYIMGKAEGHGENWHGHVTALTVSPDYRRLGLAAMLMKSLEEVSEKKQAYFVDLFVRVSNKVAIKMYQRLGYIVYRTVLEYYNGDPDEDAYDMRKALSRDVKKKSVIPLMHPVRPEDVD